MRGRRARPVRHAVPPLRRLATESHSRPTHWRDPDQRDDVPLPATAAASICDSSHAMDVVSAGTSGAGPSSPARAGTAAWRAAGRPRKGTAIWLPTRDPAGNLEYDARGTLRCERRWYVTATIPKTRGGTHEFRELVHFSWVADPAADVPGWAESMVRMMREQMPLESVEKLLQQLREWATPDRVEEQLRLLRVDEWVEATPEQVKAWTAWAGSRPGPGTASRP